MAEKNYNQLAGQKNSRIEALTDGTFAIALTLLILEIAVPHGKFQTESEVFNVFVSVLPKFLAYFLGFMTLGIFWVGHSTQFKFIEKTDRHLTWISIFFLMFASMIPFSTAFLSEYLHFKTAVAIYWFNIFLLGLTLFIHWNYAYRKKLTAENADEKIYKAVRGRIIYAQSMYAVAALLCFISPILSVALMILIQLNYAFAFFFNSSDGEKDANTKSD